MEEYLGILTFHFRFENYLQKDIFYCTYIFSLLIIRFNEKKVKTMIVNNSANIIKTYYYLSPQIIEHTKRLTYSIGHSGSGLEHTQHGLLEKTRKSLTMKDFLKIVCLCRCFFFSSARMCGLYLIVIQICLYLYTEYGTSY
jgi:hypothetical protein